MGECTVVAVLAVAALVGVTRAELCLVFFWVVKDLHVVVRKLAAVLVRTRLLLPDVLADLASISAHFPAFVAAVVVIGTPLLIMVAFGLVGALGSLEQIQVEELAQGLCFWLLRLRYG